MKNIFLQLEYNGTNYFGFQAQNKPAKLEVSVQQVLECALEKLLGQKVKIVYSSRTDRGVHARCQCVNFNCETAIPLNNIKLGLNRYLPRDVRVKKVKEAASGFHSRFNAVSKVYRYVILNSKYPCVFWNDFAWHIPRALDMGKMRAVSSLITGRHDFGIFAKKAFIYHNRERFLKAITLRKKGKFIHIDIEADGFLRNMARNIVSFLVKAGLGTLSVEEAKKVFLGKIRYSNKPAPACGLYLHKVKYK